MKKKLHLYCTISKIEFYCSITLKILVFRIFSVRDFLLCLACQLPNMAHLMLVLYVTYVHKLAPNKKFNTNPSYIHHMALENKTQVEDPFLSRKYCFGGHLSQNIIISRTIHPSASQVPNIQVGHARFFQCFCR